MRPAHPPLITKSKESTATPRITREKTGEQESSGPSLLKPPGGDAHQKPLEPEYPTPVAYDYGRSREGIHFDEERARDVAPEPLLSKMEQSCS